MDYDSCRWHLERYKDIVFTKFRAYKTTKSKANNTNEFNFFKRNARLRDIFKDCVLYAAPFSKLNDIDECRYSFSNGSDINAYDNYRLKMKRSICCFSQEDSCGYESKLMWAHYANSHYGVKIDFKIDIDRLLKIIEIYDKSNKTTTTCNIYPVFYDGISTHCNNNEEFINELDRIMTTKQGCWSYEGEYRVIFDSYKNPDNVSDKFFSPTKLPIIITKVTLGKGFVKEIVYSEASENAPFKEDIIEIARQIVDTLNSSHYGCKSSGLKIYAYKSKYSTEAKLVM